jgi:anti-repressor protein
LIAELAKILQQRGVNIGQHRLYAWLRENHYLLHSGQHYNQPSQYAMKLGLFELIHFQSISEAGNDISYLITKVTGKGQVYFIEKLLDEFESTNEQPTK